VSERLEAARHYRQLFAGADSLEADAAALRIQTLVEGGIAFLTALGKKR